MSHVTVINVTQSHNHVTQYKIVEESKRNNII